MLKQITWRFCLLSHSFVCYLWRHAALCGVCICVSSSSFDYTPFFSRRFMSMSFSTLCGSWSQSCMRTKGSLPFRLSLCQGLGLASRSETEPWVRPRIVSPNRRWPGWMTETGNEMVISKNSKAELFINRERKSNKTTQTVTSVFLTKVIISQHLLNLLCDGVSI